MNFKNILQQHTGKGLVIALVAVIVIAIASTIGGMVHQDDPVVEILDELSFGTCTDITYRICLTSTAALYRLAWVQVILDTDAVKEIYLEELTPEEARQTKSLFGDTPEETWRNIQDIEGDKLNTFQTHVREMLVGYLVARAFQDEPEIDFEWLSQNRDTLGQVAEECSVRYENAMRYEQNALVSRLNICAAKSWIIAEGSSIWLENLTPQVLYRKGMVKENLENYEALSHRLYEEADRAQGR